jgi:two-component system, NtrC family, sensor kinase
MVLLEISIQYRVIIGISAMVLLFSSFLIAFISNQRKKLQYHKNMQAIQEAQQQALVQQNILLEQRVSERTAEITQQKETLQNTLSELKASQLQLIQKEKMASLGELTAGIAHEIQNPLNFVNNFAEINTELLTEIKDRLAEETLPEALTTYINPIMDDLTENLNKIFQHGKRADSIVKNMLQHSQTHTGTMELTDLNVLAEEYLTLSFYGFRSKNKLFNCTLQTSFDKSIEKIPVIPEDIGRILVNLFNNAFYSMNEKKNSVHAAEKGEVFDPILLIKTYKKGNNTVITIRDNGMGIPKKFVDKIFQPFFTTKPTGGSTGLGLSLSYDIIKAHQGEIKVESIEGEFAEFSIELLSN